MSICADARGGMGFDMHGIVQLALAAALTALAAGLLESITPPGGGRRIVSLCGGLLLLLVLLKPFSSLVPDGGWLLPDMESGEEDREAFAGRGQEIIKDIIAERTGAYILNKSEKLGLPITVEVEVSDDVLAPTPWAVTISSKTPEHAKNALRRMLEEDLGIPAERQFYVLKEAE